MRRDPGEIPKDDFRLNHPIAFNSWSKGQADADKLASTNITYGLLLFNSLRVVEEPPCQPRAAIVEKAQKLWPRDEQNASREQNSEIPRNPKVPNIHYQHPPWSLTSCHVHSADHSASPRPATGSSLRKPVKRHDRMSCRPIRSVSLVKSWGLEVGPVGREKREERARHARLGNSRTLFCLHLLGLSSPPVCILQIRGCHWRHLKPKQRRHTGKGTSFAMIALYPSSLVV